MPRVQFKEDTALPFGGEAQFFKAGAWYTIGSAHLAMVERKGIPYIEEGVELEPVEVKQEEIKQPVIEYDQDLIAAMEALIEESDPRDFTADGAVKSSSIKRLLGRKVSTEERVSHWQYVLDH